MSGQLLLPIHLQYSVLFLPEPYIFLLKIQYINVKPSVLQCLSGKVTYHLMKYGSVIILFLKPELGPIVPYIGSLAEEKSQVFSEVSQYSTHIWEMIYSMHKSNLHAIYNIFISINMFLHYFTMKELP
jgi:hypothetical protein